MSEAQDWRGEGRVEVVRESSLQNLEQPLRRHTSGGSDITTKLSYKPNRDVDGLETGGEPPEPAEFSWLYLGIFLFVGCSHLMFWNSILNIMGDLRVVYFPSQPSAADTLTAAQTTGLVLAAIANSVYGKISIKLFLVSACGQLLVHLLTPAVLYAPTEAARAGLLHALYFLAGVSNGFFQSIGYSLGGAMPYIYTGAVAAGNGLSGLVTFAIWMIVKSVDATAVMRNLWILMAIGAAVVAASIFVVLALYRRPEVRAKITADNAAMMASKNDPDAPSYWSLLKQSWPMVLVVFITFFYTLAFFPNVGPIRWSGTGSKLDVVLGMFQVGDFVGRMMPTLPMLILSPLWVYIGTVLRFVFLIFFVLFWKKSTTSPWDNYGFQIVIMLLFALSNGWVSCCGMVHAPSMTSHLAYRGKLASMALVGLLLGLTAGSWISKLIVLGN
eukprot:Gregarina_sp_Pseudo_9__5609@NODE_769_length_2238_cov_44_051387_g724_i0_p1_GENE_NODE_769_length_2238_cov_44_051387_g724_i0NODE_769_length_2238_cov_44_051387_g724_i0_p1_ORF_typecomplete_len442_score92_55Nucleoside_tran/PF01733_18/1_7e43B12D/PF06522_11/0_64B12D/PF06522_11/1_9e03DUF2244/PF10003_9/1_1e03DUF2244/PF10003_9/3_2DUF3827/PF12877_7/2DUF3827/PF12877_7/8_8e02_NODE_769_length_2238_cov_44_051387_g724_i02161541